VRNKNNNATELVSELEYVKGAQKQKVTMRRSAT